ncbi:uncharacterized protein LOC131313992 [Rhododendron vialii]|uniref:uncharacterized protein LOC131313992 n=1 Tax=Rhododendron vialii TaxID=182163 RepID=UPI00265EA6FA|nr:uncharacterized protein LOC131313992 [Rhododendron vialii]
MVGTRNGNGSNNNNSGGNNNNGDTNQNVVAALGNVAQILQNLAANPRGLQPRTTPDRTHLFSEFRKQRPPTFQGAPDPHVADGWIHQIKKMLDTMGVQQGADQVALATYQLEGEADYWWEATKNTVNLATITWTQFEEIFLEKYFPTPIKDQMAQEFLALRQGAITVTQYMARFEELSRHASMYVPIDAAKARKFEWGLEDPLRGKVVGMELPTFSRVVRATLINERELNDSRRILNQKKNRGSNQVLHQIQQQNRAPGGVKCFHCNQEGHTKRYCPQLVGSGSSGYGVQQQQSYQGKPAGQGNQYQGNPNHQKLGWNSQQQQQRQFQNQGMRKGPGGQNQPIGG